MVNIKIKKDYFAYITCDDENIFNLIKKSLVRHIKKYNNYYKFYENSTVTYFTLVDNCTTIKTKAGIIDFLCESFKQSNIEYVLTDERNNVNIDESKAVLKLNDKITLREDQETAVKEALKQHFCCLQLPTSSGKTEISASIIRTYLNNIKDTAVIYAVPSIKLQKEAKDRFECYNIPTNTKLPIQVNKVNILTYMTLIRSKNIDYRERNRVGCFIFDEAHHLKGNKTNKIIHNFKELYYCIGLSATISDDIELKTKLKDLVDPDFSIFGCTGKCVYYKTIQDTINSKIITPIEIRLLENPEFVYLDQDELSDWHTLKNKVLMSEFRTDLIARYVKHILEDGNLNTICLLIPEIKWSQQCMILLSKYIKNARLILMYGGNKYDEIIDGNIVSLDNYKAKEAELAIKNPQIKTIFSATSFFFEGINITNLQAIVNVYGGRSVTRIKQQAGRVVRLFKNKNIAYIHEIVDKNNPILMSQLKSRLKVYTKEYNTQVIKSSFN